jgi:hypothetical protein
MRNFLAYLTTTLLTLASGATAQVPQIVSVDAVTKDASIIKNGAQARATDLSLDAPIRFTVTNLQAGRSAGVIFTTCGFPQAVSARMTSTAGGPPTYTLDADATFGNPPRHPTPPCDIRVIVDIDNADDAFVQLAIRSGSSDPSLETAEQFAKRALRGFMQRPYDVGRNEVHIVVGPNGKMLSPMPANTDQDDRFFITIVARRSELPRYDIRVDEGTYSPSDFAVRPATALTGIAQSERGAAPDPLDTTTVVRGPFTSANFKFTVTFDDQEQKKIVDLRSQSIPINPLYHAGLGISVVRSQVPSPTFAVVPLDATRNTLQQINAGRRSIAVLTGVLYWNILSPDFYRGGAITRGRDPVKESRIWDRVFPMVGIGVEKKLTDNVFVGGTFEIARGAGITAGWHYGKTTVLADPKFVLGTTVFTGEAKDIKTSSVSDNSTFVGVTVDTRLVAGILGLIK